MKELSEAQRDLLGDMVAAVDRGEAVQERRLMAWAYSLPKGSPDRARVEMLQARLPKTGTKAPAVDSKKLAQAYEDGRSRAEERNKHERAQAQRANEARYWRTVAR